MKVSLEFKVGLMTLLALLMLMVSILFVNNFGFNRGGKLYTISFNFLGDLKSDAPVKYAGGIDVGRVKDIRFDSGKAIVDILITEPHFELRQDSQVSIYATSLLGTKYVQVDANLGTGDFLKPGEVLVGHDANNLDETFSELGDVMETFEKMMGDPKAKANFLHSFENMNQATNNLLALSISSRRQINKMLADLSRSSANVPQLMASAQKVSDSLGKLIGSLNQKDVTQTMANLDETMKTINQLTQSIQHGKGTVGVLLQDPQVANDVKSLVEELKAHPWKLLWKE